MTVVHGILFERVVTPLTDRVPVVVKFLVAVVPKETVWEFPE